MIWKILIVISLILNAWCVWGIVEITSAVKTILACMELKKKTEEIRSRRMKNKFKKIINGYINGDLSEFEMLDLLNDVYDSDETEEEIRADERAKIKEEFKIYHKLEAKFTLNQCKEKDGLYYIDVTELFYGLVDQVLGESK